MRLINWSYTRKYNIKAKFEEYPHSTVIFRMIKNYYFIYTVKWSPSDPPVPRIHLEQMERLLNRELGTEHEYLKRKSSH